MHQISEVYPDYERLESGSFYDALDCSECGKTADVRFWRAMYDKICWHDREMSFQNKWAAFDWMYKNQLGRRNLTDAQKTYLLDKLCESRKHVHGATQTRQPTVPVASGVSSCSVYGLVLQRGCFGSLFLWSVV